MTLLEALIKIRDEGPDRPELGICYDLNDDLSETFKSLATKWPKWSGSYSYPVSCPHGKSARSAFVLTADEDMWNPDHPYGALRLELLNWCIEQLSTSE